MCVTQRKDQARTRGEDGRPLARERGLRTLSGRVYGHETREPPAAFGGRLSSAPVSLCGDHLPTPEKWGRGPAPQSLPSVSETRFRRTSRVRPGALAVSGKRKALLEFAGCTLRGTPAPPEAISLFSLPPQPLLCRWHRARVCPGRVRFIWDLMSGCLRSVEEQSPGGSWDPILILPHGHTGPIHQ